MDLEEYTRRSKELEKLAKRLERAEIRQEESLNKLQKIVGTDSIDEAHNKIASKKDELKKSDKKENRLIKEWDDKWQEKLKTY